MAAYHRRLCCLSKQRKCDEISGAWQPFNPLASHTQIARGRCFKQGCARRILPYSRIEGRTSPALSIRHPPMPRARLGFIAKLPEQIERRKVLRAGDSEMKIAELRP
jgi:hypothetical protein